MFNRLYVVLLLLASAAHCAADLKVLERLNAKTRISTIQLKWRHPPEVQWELRVRHNDSFEERFTGDSGVRVHAKARLGAQGSVERAQVRALRYVADFASALVKELKTRGYTVVADNEEVSEIKPDLTITARAHALVRAFDVFVTAPDGSAKSPSEEIALLEIDVKLSLTEPSGGIVGEVSFTPKRLIRSIISGEEERANEGQEVRAAAQKFGQYLGKPPTPPGKR